MKNLRTNLFFVASIAIWMVLATACTDYEPPRQYVPDGVRAYFNYKVGSYWLMKDSATGALDSFYVTNYYDDNSSTSESISVYMLRKNATASLSLNITPNQVTMNTTSTTSLLGASYVIAINYPFWLGKQSPDHGQYEMLFFSKKIINGGLEDNVYVACDSGIVGNDNYDDTVSFNSSKGFLALNFKNSLERHNWILQRQNIVR